jgi:hypothetical protein
MSFAPEMVTKCDPALPRMPTSSNKSPNVSKVVLSTFPWHVLGIENVRGEESALQRCIRNNVPGVVRKKDIKSQWKRVKKVYKNGRYRDFRRYCAANDEAHTQH